MVVGDGSAEACCSVTARVKCDKPFVSMVSYSTPKSEPKEFATLNRTCFVSWNVHCWVESKMQGVRSKFAFGSSMVYNDISLALFERYLPDDMAEGTFAATTEPRSGWTSCLGEECCCIVMRILGVQSCDVHTHGRVY
jgi:hypothetical protein